MKTVPLLIVGSRKKDPNSKTGVRFSKTASGISKTIRKFCKTSPVFCKTHPIFSKTSLQMAEIDADFVLINRFFQR